jgi:peptide/nickel transport system permease protein
MLSNGVDYLLFAPRLSLVPGLAIALTVLAFNFLGDALRDRLDPKAEPWGR